MVNKAQKVRDYMRAHPTATPVEIAEKCKVPRQYVYQVRSDMTKKALAKFTLPNGKLKIRMQSSQDKKWQPPELLPVPPIDNVNHPPHYKVGGIETIDFIEAKGLDYHLGNVVKYITRADHKSNKLEDLKKAEWYLQRAISKLA